MSAPTPKSVSAVLRDELGRYTTARGDWRMWHLPEQQIVISVGYVGGGVVVRARRAGVVVPLEWATPEELRQAVRALVYSRSRAVSR